jgi:bifunctional UDP-N-acetylglucosamine pyrophosphorylase / glucosamine-1-phosphate N-acetyltransferase
MKNDLSIIILAAGKGTRMKSAKPKVLHKVAGLPLISHVIKTAESLRPKKIVVVVGPDMDDVAAVAKPHAIAVQRTQKGTGDAVKAAIPHLKNFKGDVLVLYGDVPLVQAEELKQLIKARRDKKAGLALAAMRPANPGGYGRMVLNPDGSLKKIIEARDASAAEKEITLCSAGIICADFENLEKWLDKITNKNAQKEYYLTTLPEIAAAENSKNIVFEVPAQSMAGVNDRIDLAMVETLFQRRKRLEMLQSGVTMIDPETVYFSHDTKIAVDVMIEPNVIFGEGVSIGSGSNIRAFSHIEGADIGKNVNIGPFARLRPGSVIGEDVRIGNFVEIKKSKIGKGAKIGHLSYVGDTLMGDETNFSAGAITVNYDGFDKYKTVIGKNVMIGSNVNLVAPVKIDDGAIVAAGSTITDNVQANALSIARERQTDRKNWAAEFRKKKKVKKK